MKKLFFDLSITGHHAEYISHLVDFINKNKDDNDYIFVVHPNFSQEFPSIAEKAMCIQNVIWIQVTIPEYERCTKAKLVKKSFIEFQIVNRYAMLYEVDEVFLLSFNTFQLATWFYRPSYTLSGILFLQFYRMSRNTLRANFRYYRKYFTTLLFTLNPRIKKIYVLNDEKSVNYFNNQFKTDIFEMLPDPIPDLLPLEQFDIHEHYKIPGNRKIFLHIGALGDRKGTFEIIKAFNHFSKDIENKIAVLLAGKADSVETEKLILNKIAEAKKNPHVKIVWDNQFVSNSHMKSLFDQCDAVLIPYKNSEASSGILGHAAASHKLVISTGKGLLKEIILNHQLGVVVNNVNSKEIALQIGNLITQSNSFDVEGANTFILSHRPDFFAKQILNKKIK